MSSPATSPAVRRVTARRPRPYWPIGAGLIALGLLPVLARRLAVAAAEDQGVPAPEPPLALLLPVVVHVGGALIYVVLGALQFSARFRQRRPGWHRVAGRVLVLAGLAAALSGLWLAQAHALVEGPTLLYVVRLVFGLAMVLSLVAGFRAILRRDVPGHRAWMIRAYAIGLGAGTQLFALGFGQAILGTGDVSEALLTAAAWVINLGVAELAILRQLTPVRIAPSDDGPRAGPERAAGTAPRR